MPISRIKNLTYSSGVNPFSTSTQILGDKSQTTSGVALSGSSSTYSLSTYTSGVTSLSAATATTALTVYTPAAKVVAPGIVGF